MVFAFGVAGTAQKFTSRLIRHLIALLFRCSEGAMPQLPHSKELAVKAVKLMNGGKVELALPQIEVPPRGEPRTQTNC
ncbi:hypothetical protein D9M69_670210 [compost metagenome]